MKRSWVIVSLMAVAVLGGCKKSVAPPVANDKVTVTQSGPPPGGSWADVVNATSSGNFVMGNPAAKVKLIEIGSLSCPHCMVFENEGVPQLLDKYVKTGQVSWEFRPYLIHGPIDVAADLIARCNGAQSFFPLVQALYKAQPTWMANIESAPSDKLSAIQKLPPEKAFVAMADLLGLQDWAAARGVPHAKSDRCLSDQKMINAEVQVTSDVNNQFPEFSGTPAFVVNGELQPKETVTFERLEPALQAALK